MIGSTLGTCLVKHYLPTYIWVHYLCTFEYNKYLRAHNIHCGILPTFEHITSVTSNKFPNVSKSYPKRISLAKWKILTPLQKLPKMCWWFGQNKLLPTLKSWPKYVVSLPEVLKSCPKCNKSANTCWRLTTEWQMIFVKFLLKISQKFRQP